MRRLSSYCRRCTGFEAPLFGPEHTETLNTMNNLATVYFALGRNAEARSLYEKILDVWRRTRLGARNIRGLSRS